VFTALDGSVDFSLFFILCELLLCSKLCFAVLVFFYSTATIPTAAAAVFLYLFIERVCFCLFSFDDLLRAGVWARSVNSFYFLLLLLR
jgi:hypothetical protein